MGTMRVLLICALSIIVTVAYSQPGAGDPNEGGKPGTVPISGIEILIGLGGLLGAKKIFDAKRKKN